MDSYYSTHTLVRKYFNTAEAPEDFKLIADLYAKRPENTRAVTTIEDWMFIHDFISCIKPNFIRHIIFTFRASTVWINIIR